jgi:hypothetical protein
MQIYEITPQYRTFIAQLKKLKRILKQFKVVNKLYSRYRK